MSFFRRVEPRHASAAALGLLIPQSNPTLLIVRPRALGWDLLPARWTGRAEHAPQFCRFPRDEAALLARRLIADLDDAVRRGLNPVETFGANSAFQIWVRASDLFWIACRGDPGQGYQPVVFPSLAQAAEAGEELARFVWPAPQSVQEYYVNTQKFGA